jgi:hypothetical protein
MPTLHVVTQVHGEHCRGDFQAITYADETEVRQALRQQQDTLRQQQDALRQQQEALRRGLREIRSELERRFEAVESQVEQTATDLQEFRADANRRLQGLTGEVAQLRDELGAVRNTLHTAADMTVGMANTVQQTNTQLAQAAGTLDRCLQTLNRYGESLRNEVRQTAELQRDTAAQIMRARAATTQQFAALAEAVLNAAAAGESGLARLASDVRQTGEHVTQQLEQVRGQGETFSQAMAQAAKERGTLQRLQVESHREAQGESARAGDHVQQLAAHAAAFIAEGRRTSQSEQRASRDERLRAAVRCASTSSPVPPMSEDSPDPLLQLADALRWARSSPERAEQAFQQYLGSLPAEGSVSEPMPPAVLAALRLAGVRLPSVATSPGSKSRRVATTSPVRDFLEVLLELHAGSPSECVRQLQEPGPGLAWAAHPLAASLVSCYGLD